MKRILLFYCCIVAVAGLQAQLPAYHWKGTLTQTGGKDTFSYELQLQGDGQQLNGIAYSVNPRGDKARFAVRGSWDGKQLLLQELKQEEPAEPRWCLKYVKLSLEQDVLGRAVLQGNWQAEGCRPGILRMWAVDSENATTQTGAGREGRWTGHLDQADRAYGFYYELELRADGKGSSHIVSEDNGGTASHALAWFWDSIRQVVTIREDKVVEKTDANWPWCIKQAELKLERFPQRQVLTGDWSGFIEGHTWKEGACASGKMYLEKPIVAQQTRQKVESRSQVYEKEQGRKLRIDRVVQVSSPNLRIRVWDNGTVDGDIVTIFLNGQQLVRKFRVNKHKWSMPVKLTEPENLLIIHAEDLGDITPNTVAVSIDDGTKEEVLVISSDLRVSGGILIQPFTFESGK